MCQHKHPEHSYETKWPKKDVSHQIKYATTGKKSPSQFSRSSHAAQAANFGFDRKLASYQGEQAARITPTTHERTGKASNTKWTNLGCLGSCRFRLLQNQFKPRQVARVNSPLDPCYTLYTSSFKYTCMKSIL